MGNGDRGSTHHRPARPNMANRECSLSMGVVRLYCKNAEPEPQWFLCVENEMLLALYVKTPYVDFKTEQRHCSVLLNVSIQCVDHVSTDQTSPSPKKELLILPEHLCSSMFFVGSCYSVISLFSVQCFVDHCCHNVFFSFGYYIVCPTIYDF